ncbi:SMCA4 protein, partial [Sclerurus mexicanus]|nr:SMCA4 protein [Sclerurus mexicanus]
APDSMHPLHKPLDALHEKGLAEDPRYGTMKGMGLRPGGHAGMGPPPSPMDQHSQGWERGKSPGRAGGPALGPGVWGGFSIPGRILGLEGGFGCSEGLPGPNPEFWGGFQHSKGLTGPNPEFWGGFQHSKGSPGLNPGHPIPSMGSVGSSSRSIPGILIPTSLTFLLGISLGNQLPHGIFLFFSRCLPRSWEFPGMGGPNMPPPGPSGVPPGMPGQPPGGPPKPWPEAKGFHLQPNNSPSLPFPSLPFPSLPSPPGFPERSCGGRGCPRARRMRCQGRLGAPRPVGRSTAGWLRGKRGKGRAELQARIAHRIQELENLPGSLAGDLRTKATIELKALRLLNFQRQV